MKDPLYTLTKLYLESKVCGSWMFSTVVIFGSHWDLTGFAAARIDVLAFNWQIMPALAIDNVCCSLEKQNYINQWLLTAPLSPKRGVGWGGGCRDQNSGMCWKSTDKMNKMLFFRSGGVRSKINWKGKPWFIQMSDKDLFSSESHIKICVGRGGNTKYSKPKTP